MRQRRGLPLLSASDSLALFLILLLGVLLSFTSKKRRIFSLLGTLSVVFVLAIWGKGSGAASSATTITVTASSGNLSRSLPVVLRVE